MFTTSLWNRLFTYRQDILAITIPVVTETQQKLPEIHCITFQIANAIISGLYNSYLPREKVFLWRLL